MQAYWSIGRNQLELQGKFPPAKWNMAADPGYSTALGALDHLINSSFGQFDSDSYYDSPMTIVVYPLFILVCIIEFVLLINLIIALMSNIMLTSR
jgi:hypothetical protein